MAITRIGAASGTNTATMPAHQAGDLLLVFAYRDGSTAQPTAPTGWTTNQVIAGAANTNAARLHAKIAASSSETVGTWTNATSVIVVVYRGSVGSFLGVGARNQTGGTSTTINYPALTGMRTDNTSWVAAFAGHRSVNTALQDAPSGMTNFATVVDATDEAAGHDTNGTVTSWSSTNVSAGGTSSGYRSIVVEVTEYTPPAGTNPSSIMGSAAISWIDVDLGGMTQDTARATPAAVGDPVRSLPDWANGTPFAHVGGTVGVPVLRDGYLEFDAGFLRKAISRASGAIAWGVQLRLVNDISGATHHAVIIGGSNSEWYAAPVVVRVDQNGFFSPDRLYWDSVDDQNAPINTFATVQGQAGSNGAALYHINGISDGAVTTPDVPPLGANFIWLGGAGVNFGTFSADPGRYDIARFYLLDTVPTEGQRAALLDWLENGDPGGGAEITGSGTVVLPAVVASGTGTAQRIVSGSGAATLPAADSAGAATRTVTGAGDATLGEVTATGNAARVVTGAGTTTLPALTVGGAGARTITTAGAALLPSAGANGAGARVVASTGAVSLAPATATGEGTRTVTGAGTATLPPVDASGAPAQNVTGTGVVTLPAVDANGVALRQVNGAGTATLPAGQSSGAATREIAGTGAASLPPADAAGTGAREVSSAGAAALPAAAGAGTGTRTVTGTGETDLPAAAASGAATRAVTGAGAVALPATTADGLAGVNGALTAFGDVTLPAAAASGAGTRTVTGSGIVLLPAANVNAAVTREIVGSGATTIPAATAFGSSGANVNITGSGAVALPAANSVGAGAREVAGAGAMELPGADGTGTATRVVTGSGAVALPGLDAAGSGAREVNGVGGPILPFVASTGTATRQVNGVGTTLLPAIMAKGSEAVLSGRRAALVGAPANRGSVVPRDTGSLVISGNSGRVMQTSGGGSLAGSRGKGRLT